MVGPRENFSKLRFSEGLKNAILRLEFTNTIFHKRAMLLIFYAEYTASVLEILSYPESTMAHGGWAWKKFSKWVFSEGWNTLL